MKNSLLIVLLVLCAAACKHIDVYEKMAFFPKQEWNSDVKPSFTFNIQDTTARYNVYVVLRHGDGYHFSNLWLDITRISPGDTAITAKANLKLGDNNQWLGNSLDDIVEHRFLINTYPLQLKAGSHKFTIKQLMREDPLQNVLNAGIRVEKAMQ